MYVYCTLLLLLLLLPPKKVQGGSQSGQVLSLIRTIALLQKLSLSLFVCHLSSLNFLLDGRSLNTWCPGCVQSSKMLRALLRQ